MAEVSSREARNVTMSLHEVLRAQAFNHISGDDSQGGPPVPMPNTVVKPLYAESTRLETVREDRALPVGRASCSRYAAGCFSFLFFLSLFVPSPFLKLARPQRKIPCIRAFRMHERGSLLPLHHGRKSQIADCCWLLTADRHPQHQSLYIAGRRPQIADRC